MIRYSQIILLAALYTTPLFAAEPPSDVEKLTKSHEKWQSVKKDCQGNYSYTVRFSSFAGFGNSTEIVVRDNKVVERKYRSFTTRPAAPVAPGQPAPKPAGDNWSEAGKQLGSHKRGAPLKTLDDLYSEAEKVVVRELPQHVRRYVRLDKQGLLLSCFTVDTRIADDAPTQGVNINAITLTKTKGVGEHDTVHTSPNGKPFPKHWGAPPRLQTRDLRSLPGGFGRGSGTLVKWIRENMEKDEKKKDK